jgi:hypothetical protein
MSSRKRLPPPGHASAFIGIYSFITTIIIAPFAPSFVLRATLRLTGVVPPQRNPGILAPIPI